MKKLEVEISSVPLKGRHDELRLSRSRAIESTQDSFGGEKESVVAPIDLAPGFLVRRKRGGSRSPEMQKTERSVDRKASPRSHI